MRNLSDDKPVIQGKSQEAPELTILRREKTVNNTDVSKGITTDSKEVVRSLVEKIPEKILEQTKVRDKKVTFREEIEHLGLDQESGEWSRFMEEDETGEGKLSGERKEWDEDSDESSEDQDSPMHDTGGREDETARQGITDRSIFRNVQSGNARGTRWNRARENSSFKKAS